MKLLKTSTKVNLSPGPQGVLIREEYTDGTFAWLNTLGYERGDSETLEREYQKLINKPVETTKEQPKIQEGLYFDKEDLKPLYYLLSRTNSRKYMDELDVFLERIAFSLKG